MSAAVTPTPLTFICTHSFPSSFPPNAPHTPRRSSTISFYFVSTFATIIIVSHRKLSAKCMTGVSMVCRWWRRSWGELFLSCTHIHTHTHSLIYGCGCGCGCVCSVWHILTEYLQSARILISAFLLDYDWQMAKTSSPTPHSPSGRRHALTVGMGAQYKQAS